MLALVDLYLCIHRKLLHYLKVLSFVDPLLLTHFSDTPHSLCTEALFYETVSVIGFLASEYSLAI